MRILIATGLYPPEIGGPATYTALLEKELPIRGYTVEVAPFSVSRKFPKVLRHIHYFLSLCRLGRSSDIVFAQDTVSVGLPAFLASRLMGKKIFIRVPGDYAWEQSVQRYGVSDDIDSFQKKEYGWRVELLRSVQRFVVRNSDTIITPSDYFNELVSGWGVESKKIYTIYNGLNLDIKSEHINKSSHKTIVTAGRLVPWKGFDTLIEILSQLDGWKLVIIGNGPDKERLEEIIQKKGLRERVSIVGPLSREAVFGWCRAADVFVLNTKFESFSFQLVEAMSSGTPVITTNTGSLPELLTSPEEGILLKPDDKEGLLTAIQSVFTEPEVWRLRTERAVKKSQQFSIEKTVDNLCRLFKA